MIEEWTRPFFRMDNGLQIYPREIMTFTQPERPPLRTEVNNNRDFGTYMRVFNKDCYVSVFSNWQRENNTYDTIPLDIDNHDEGGLSLAYEKYRNVLEILNDKEIESRLVCSTRGFHIYVDYPPICFKNYSETVTEWIGISGLTNLVDVIVSKDVRRVMRVPYTINTKTGMWAVPIKEEDNLDDIKKMIKIGTGHGYTRWENGNDKIRNELKEIDSSQRRLIKKKIQGVGYLALTKQIPPCIQGMMEKVMVSGTLEYDPRHMLISFLLRIMEIERVESFCQNFVNYSSWLTNYHIQYLARKEYNLYGCKKISLFGYCRYAKCMEKCPYWPSISKWI